MTSGIKDFIGPEKRASKLNSITKFSNIALQKFSKGPLSQEIKLVRTSEVKLHNIMHAVEQEEDRNFKHFRSPFLGSLGEERSPAGKSSAMTLPLELLLGAS